MWNLKAVGCVRGIILAGVVMGVCGRSVGVTVNSVWDGSGGNNWNDATHWVPTGAPNNGTGAGGPQYTVEVDGGLVDMNISPTVNSVRVAAGAEVDSGANQTLQVTGSLMNSGNLFLDGLTVAGTVTNAGNLDTGNGGNVTLGALNNSGFVETSSTDTGNTTYAITGTLNNSGGGFEVDTGTTATAAGLTLTGGQLVVQVGASFEVTGSGNGTFLTDVPAGATVAVQGGFWVGQTPGLNNVGSVEGTLVLGMSQEYTSMGNLTVSNTGFVVLENGTELFAGTITNYGTLLTNFLGTAGTTLNVSDFNNEAGAQFTIFPQDHLVVGDRINNWGTMTIEQNNISIALYGGNGTVVEDAAQLTIAVGTSTNMITDNGAGDKLTVLQVQTGAIRVGSLVVEGPERLTIDSPGAASKVNSLKLLLNPDNISAKVQLLLGSPLVMEGSGSAHAGLLAQMKAYVASGSTGGIYDGGLTPAQRMVVSDFAVTDGSLPQVTSFEGVSVDSGSVVVEPTWLGDANLDGVVDIKDLQVLANHWQQSVSDWRQGDFDGNGIVDIIDLQNLANHWQAGAGSGGGSGESFSEALNLIGGLSAVPEPGAVVVLGLGVMCGVVRRRRV